MRHLKKLAISLLTLATLFAFSNPVFAQESDKDKSKESKAEKTANFKLDGSHTFAMFRASHFGVGYVYGRFNKIEGSFSFKDGKPTDIKIGIDLTSADTGVEKRDKHLQSPDFFNAKQFPKMKFESTSVEKTGEDTYKVSGKLSLHGKTKSLSFTLDQTGSGKDPKGNFRRGYHAEFSFDRTDFGMDYQTEAFGKEVKVIFSAEGIKQ